MSWKPEPIPFKPNAMIGGIPVMVVPSEHNGLLRYITSTGTQQLENPSCFEPLSRKVTRFILVKRPIQEEDDWYVLSTHKTRQEAFADAIGRPNGTYVVKPITIDMNEFEAEPDWDEPPGG